MTIMILMIITVCAMAAGVAATVAIFVRNKKRGLEPTDRFKYSVGAFACILVAFANWCVNHGNLREMLAMPMFIHTLIFFVVTWFSSGHIAKSEALEKAVAMGIVMFLFMHLLLPDISADQNSVYFMFFRLIHSDQAATVFIMIALTALIVNIVMLIRQLYLTIRLR